MVYIIILKDLSLNYVPQHKKNQIFINKNINQNKIMHKIKN